MLYVCTWKTKRSEGTKDVEASTAKDARKKVRAEFRDSWGLKVHIVSMQRWEAGKERQKSK